MEPEDLPPPLPPPDRPLDTVAFEDLEDLVDPESPDRALVKSRDFSDVLEVNISPSDVKVVLFDCFSMDSFAGCYASKKALGSRAQYVGVNRSQTIDSLQTVDGDPLDVAGKVVAMVGVCWSVEAILDMLNEGAVLLVLETHHSVARQLEHLSHSRFCMVLDPGMGAGALAWNFFLPGEPVPPLIRALEDAELGRRVFRDAVAFADGLESYLQRELPDFEVPRGEVQCTGREFTLFEYLLDDGGRSTINRAVEEGLSLQPTIQAECEAAGAKTDVKMVRMFPSWR